MSESETVRTLRCPSCDGRMREVDRRGLTIDICNECKGIFLDRGELETLLESVDRWAEAQQAEAQAAGAQQRPPGPIPTVPPPPQPGQAPGPPPTAPPPPPGHHPGPGPGIPPTAPPPPPGQPYPPAPGYGQQPYAAQGGYPQPYGQPGHGQKGLGEIISMVVRESSKHGKHGYGHHGYGHKKRRKGGLGELFGDLLD